MHVCVGKKRISVDYIWNVDLRIAVAKAAGLTPDAFPADAGISEELLEALANNSVSPEDIEIVKDEESGKSTLRSKSQLSKAMGGVKEGHLFVSPGEAGLSPLLITLQLQWYMDITNYKRPEKSVRNIHCSLYTFLLGNFRHLG